MTSTARHGFNEHQETWLLLPWLVTGRLSEAQREQTRQHVRICGACNTELHLQRRLYAALATPDRVSHAPGPSLVKLMRRIDRTSFRPGASQHVQRSPDPCFAWAATALVAGALLGTLAYRGLAPAYRVHADDPAGASQVLHIAFARDLTVDEMQTLLSSAGAQVVEGPQAGGLFGVRATAGADAGQLQNLARRLRDEPQIRWVEPLPSQEPSGTPREP
jgi:hypothetical protein